MSTHRLVFFIGGFDPRPAARWHRLYREAAAGHPAADGERVEVGPRERVSALLERWAVRWQPREGEALATLHHVLRWDDLVRRHWPRSAGQRLRHDLRDAFNLYVRAAAQGVLREVRRASWPSYAMTLAPLATGLLLGLAWVLLVACLAWAAPPLGVWPWGPAAGAWLASWAWLDRRLDGGWLLRLYGFTCLQGQGRLPELEQRLDDWADALVQQAGRTPARELLVVGHSVGTLLAVEVLARACRRAPWLAQAADRQLALLTLGHCTPALAHFPAAQGFRQALAELADLPGLTWHDVSAARDWAAFARVPPWLGAGGRARLAQRSPRFHATLGREAYQALLADRAALHLQYLRAPRHAGGYDPVAWMAGPSTLAERHAALAPRDGTGNATGSAP